jgi:hypothetical protein
VPLCTVTVTVTEYLIQQRMLKEYEQSARQALQEIKLCPGSALGCWVKEGWDELFIFLRNMLLK